VFTSRSAGFQSYESVVFVTDGIPSTAPRLDRVGRRTIHQPCPTHPGMDVAILTVGDELLSGDTVDTNAAWLAAQVTRRGGSVRRMLTLPDDADQIAAALRELRDRFDAVVVTGGLGGTHDDVTMDAVAAAFDRELVVDERARQDVLETAAAYRAANPDVVERYPEFDLDVDAWAAVPDGARVLLNPAGLSPGCVVDGVYVLPGIPEEMEATFGLVAHEFGGDAVSETLYTPAPEAAVTAALATVRDRFDVTVGSYPDVGGGHNRIRIVGTDRATVAQAAAWVRDHVDVVEGDADRATQEDDDADRATQEDDDADRATQEDDDA
jgi:molybdenum cofactor synthesis domain-containing protein